MSQRCPESHCPRIHLDFYGCGNRQVSDGLVMTPILRVTAETVASPSTCKPVACTPNGLATITVEKLSCKS